MTFLMIMPLAEAKLVFGSTGCPVHYVVSVVPDLWCRAFTLLAKFYVFLRNESNNVMAPPE